MARRTLLRGLALMATSALAMCGVKGPPRPPEAVQAEPPATGTPAGAAAPSPPPAAGDAGPPP